MPTYSSPGNYVIEKDFSEYAPAVNSSIAGIVGFASRGPANKATLITSPAQLIRTFGETDQVVGGQGLLAALEILARTNSIYFVRAENGTTATEASGLVSWGACPALQVSGLTPNTEINFYFSSTDETGTSNTPGGDGYKLNLTTTSTADGTGDLAADVLAAQAGIETVDWPWTAVSGFDMSSVYFVNTHAGKDAYLQVSSDGGFGTNAFNASGDATPTVDPVSAVKAGGYTVSGVNQDGGVYFVESLYNGAGYNASTTTTAQGVVNYGIKVKVDSRAGKYFNFEVLNEGVAAETFEMNFEQSAGVKGYFPEDVVNIGLTDNVSEYIKASFKDSAGAEDNAWTPPTLWTSKMTGGVNLEDSGGDLYRDANPRFVKMVDGTYSLSGGVNGDTAGGAITGDVRSALLGAAATKTGIHALDDDSLNISMAAVPGITEQQVQNELITLAENSQNFLAVVAPPEGLTTPQKAINWHNGQGDGRTASINSSYAAIYWPWLKVFDVATATDIYLDPAAYAISVMCHTDAVSDPWFAPAGLTRGRLTKPTDVEVILNQGDRDSLYQPGNAVNPIAKFAQDGICIWGQRTAQRTPSALDRVNVRRMMIQIRKMILAATRQIVFEPNDPLTWNRVVNLLQPAIDEIRRRRGITEFRVICDDTTNTPLRIDRNEMWCRVLIKPTKTAEVLVFELNLTNQSANLGG